MIINLNYVLGGLGILGAGGTALYLHSKRKAVKEQELRPRVELKNQTTTTVDYKMTAGGHTVEGTATHGRMFQKIVDGYTFQYWTEDILLLFVVLDANQTVVADGDIGFYE